MQHIHSSLTPIQSNINANTDTSTNSFSGGQKFGPSRTCIAPEEDRHSLKRQRRSLSTSCGALDARATSRAGASVHCRCALRGLPSCHDQACLSCFATSPACASVSTGQIGQAGTDLSSNGTQRYRINHNVRLPQRCTRWRCTSTSYRGDPARGTKLWKILAVREAPNGEAGCTAKPGLRQRCTRSGVR